MEKCPQCSQAIEEKKNRLVQDSCGHKKCRTCLLKDEFSCQSCSINGSIEKKSVINSGENVGCNKTNANSSTSNVNIKEELDNVSCIPPEENKSIGISSAEITERSDHSSELPSHISINGDKHLTCNICNKSFSTPAHVKYHKYCSGGQKPYSCDICQKEFITKSHFESHKYSHASVKPHMCHVCQKEFNQKSKLSRHLSLHEDAKPYVCQDCGKSFKSKDYLRSHSLIHKKEKPYACKQCSAKFNNSSNLKKHVASHSKDKQHMCDQCGKRFKLKWALTVHRRSHSSIKPHQCNNCSKAFYNLKDLQRHELIHSGIKAYKCGVCKADFRRKDNLERHMKNTHPGEKVPPIKTEVKKVIKPPVPTVKSETIDNPNAINVITFSISQLNKVPEETPKHTPVIHAPLKLAFKTSAFKNCYNIHRDYIEPETDSANINIYQKILSPHPTKYISSKTDKDIKKDSIETCRNILKPMPPPTAPLHYETSFEERSHAIIKNIKFKLPSKYTNLYNDKISEIKPLQPTSNIDVKLEEKLLNNETYTELKAVREPGTSVIVNSYSDTNYCRQDKL